VDSQSLSYALLQVAHNAGAVAVAGGATVARWQAGSAAQRLMLAKWVAAGWLTQIASGAGFGAVSFHYYGQFPDIHGIAVIALVIKAACAVSGLALSLQYLRNQRARAAARVDLIWNFLVGAGWTALAAAAFLRWFS